MAFVQNSSDSMSASKFFVKISSYGKVALSKSTDLPIRGISVFFHFFQFLQHHIGREETDGVLKIVVR